MEFGSRASAATEECGVASSVIGGLGSGDTTVVNAESNKVIIATGSDVTVAMIAGGAALPATGNSGNANQNGVNIDGGTVGGTKSDGKTPAAVAGAYAIGSGNKVNSNTATLASGSLTGGLVGGAAYGEGSTASLNMAKVTGGTFTGAANPYIATVFSDGIFGGAAANGASATNNEVVIEGDSSKVETAYVIGGVGTGDFTQTGTT